MGDRAYIIQHSLLSLRMDCFSGLVKLLDAMNTFVEIWYEYACYLLTRHVPLKKRGFSRTPPMIDVDYEIL